MESKNILENIDFPLLANLALRQMKCELDKGKRIEDLIDKMYSIQTDINLSNEEKELRLCELNTEKKELVKNSIIYDYDNSATFRALMSFIPSLVVCCNPKLSEKMKKRLEYLDAGGKLEDCEPLFNIPPEKEELSFVEERLKELLESGNELPPEKEELSFDEEERIKELLESHF